LTLAPSAIILLNAQEVFMVRTVTKIITFLILTIVLGILLSGPINLLLYWLFQPLRWLGLSERVLSDIKVTGKWELATNHFSLVPAVLIASLIMTRRFEGRPLASLGLSLRSTWPRDFMLGVLLAFIAITPVIFILHFFNPYIAIGFPSTSTLTDWLTIGGGILLGLLILFGALFEELIFRGYPFQTLISVIGQWPTILATSSIFAIVHFTTHRISSIVAAGIIGLIIALLYLQSRSLWVATGFHAGVNGVFTISAILRLISLSGSGENWLFPGITGVMALILAIAVLKYLKPSSEMEALWQQYVPIAQPWAQLKAWWAKRKGLAEESSQGPRPPAS
jgi:membrane protease YdiL (CAAX protease family)